tara:strand:+ start:810 stop:1436 length:627 start_codon:yes stop_codon:yes gene_type:complete
MSYRFLHNPKTPEYLDWKAKALDIGFPWFYNESTAGPVRLEELGLTASDDTSFWCHCVVSRPDSLPYVKPYITFDRNRPAPCSEMFDQTMRVMTEIANINNIPFQPIRMAFNCTTPGEVQQSIAHVDHFFPHDNFLIYLTSFTGGNTWVEGHGEVPAEEDMIFMLDGSVRHAAQRPTGSNERRIVFVATSGVVPDHIHEENSEADVQV